MTASLEEHLQRTASMERNNGPHKDQTDTLPSVADTATTMDLEMDVMDALLLHPDEDTLSEMSLAKESSLSVTESPHDLSYRSMCASSVRSEAHPRRRLSTASAASTGSRSRTQAQRLRSPGGWKNKIKVPRPAGTGTGTAEEDPHPSWHSCSASVLSRSSPASTPATSSDAGPAKASPKDQALRLAAMMQPQAQEQNPEKEQTQQVSTFTLDYLAEAIAQSTFMKNMDYLFGPRPDSSS